MHRLSPGTLACVFDGTIFAFIGFYVGASKNTAAYVFVDIVVFVVFYTDWVAFSACITEQARGGGVLSTGKVEHVVGKGDGGLFGWKPWASWGERYGWEWEWWRWRCEWDWKREWECAEAEFIG